MIELITEISLYLMVAILLGFIFGWLISKASWKEHYEKELEKLKVLYMENQNKVEDKKQVRGDKKIIKTKDERIEKLSCKLSQEEESIFALKKEHEREMSAFIFEHAEITQKYQELLRKIEEIKKSQSL
jgi:uncharacterized protein YeeX (DUF496 family)